MQEGEWVEVFTGKEMTWKNWAKKQPASKTEDQDCAVINKEGKFEAIRCSDTALTVCRVQGPVRFQLRGVCQYSGLDTQYTMLNSSYMIGNINTVISKRDTDGWSIVDKDSKVLASAGTNFPLGSQQWTFLGKIRE